MVFPDAELETAIAQVETDLMALKIRYQDVCAAQQKITELQAQQAKIMAQPEEIQKQESLKTELQLIAEEIEKLELQLESKLLNWQEPFWQIVRFTGLGVLIGWFLKTVV